MIIEEICKMITKITNGGKNTTKTLCSLFVRLIKMKVRNTINTNIYYCTLVLNYVVYYNIIDSLSSIFCVCSCT